MPFWRCHPAILAVYAIQYMSVCNTIHGVCNAIHVGQSVLSGIHKCIVWDTKAYEMDYRSVCNTIQVVYAIRYNEVYAMRYSVCNTIRWCMKFHTGAPRKTCVVPVYEISYRGARRRGGEPVHYVKFCPPVWRLDRGPITYIMLNFRLPVSRRYSRARTCARTLLRAETKIRAYCYAGISLLSCSLPLC
jgi:hypothetical protein